MPKNCLIVIDMLNDFLDHWEPGNCARLVANTNQLIDAFRASGCPVIWVRQAFQRDLSDAFLEMRDKKISITIDGTLGAEIHSGLNREPSDPVVTKKRYSAFFGTNLDALLAKLDVDQITLAGVNTHACIRMAAIDAYQRDIRVTIAADCVDSQDLEHARVSLAYLSGKIAALRDNAEIIGSL